MAKSKHNFMKGIVEKVLNGVLQKCFWVYPYNIFVINGLHELKMIKPKIKCEFIPITPENCYRVADFREKGRIAEYRKKLAHNEIGYFAEYEGKVIGSIWATVNQTSAPRVVRTYMKLMPNEGLTHDNVVSPAFRGMGVGPFLASSLRALLFKEYGLKRLMADVSVRNWASLRMNEKQGLRVNRKMLFICLFNRPVIAMVLKKYDNTGTSQNTKSGIPASQMEAESGERSNVTFHKLKGLLTHIWI